MVYREAGQTHLYYARGEPHLTTTQHFHDQPNAREPHKKSTAGVLYSGSHFFTSQLMATKPRNATMTTIKFGTSGSSAATTTFPRMSRAAGTGGGPFVVELPHSTITYRALKITPGAKLTAWKTEYSDKYTKKAPTSGYSVLRSRRI